MSGLPYPNSKGKRRVIKSISGEKVAFHVEDEIVIPFGLGKLIYFQKMKWEADQRTEYRFTYYMSGHKPGRKGKWVFGQYSLMIPAKELSMLLAEAKARGWEGI
ncbi:hypothetical protein SAMN04488068_2750 [Hydrocarboniphaga daqingensis]|uniref:Uncharacterized protein n=1 Tax=Hydrocarboniphaga daqingensis TaxID=490188 RepID=A0A1M5QQI3_9GAMM|nr:hypothetical protein [Hydrocarboniphaga daqingensis]SHH16000.1 hypothetical protein SAMN04488068_2750 [Hydrocarboniphaga daqingensis]